MNLPLPSLGNIDINNNLLRRCLHRGLLELRGMCLHWRLLRHRGLGCHTRLLLHGLGRLLRHAHGALLLISPGGCIDIHDSGIQCHVLHDLFCGELLFLRIAEHEGVYIHIAIVFEGHLE